MYIGVGTYSMSLYMYRVISTCTRCFGICLHTSQLWPWGSSPLILCNSFTSDTVLLDFIMMNTVWFPLTLKKITSYTDSILQIIWLKIYESSWVRPTADAYQWTWLFSVSGSSPYMAARLVALKLAWARCHYQTSVLGQILVLHSSGLWLESNNQARI